MDQLVLHHPLLASRIERWRTAAGDGLELAGLVAAQVRATGRHHLGEPLLAALEDLQHRHRGHDAFLDAYLDCILARRQDRFGNQTYLALPLLDRILADPSSDLDPERLSALLVADVIRHEARPASLERTGPTTQRKRIQHAARIVAAIDPDSCPVPPRTTAGEWLALTVQPVSTEHDEYFFIRALQTHELVFTTLTAELHRATRALRHGRIGAATAAVGRANVVFERATLLFRMVATMRAADFHAFRVYTDGASAIQSEAYKRFELACGRPAAARLASDAFTNVPAVRAEASRQDNLSDAYLDLRRQGRVDPAAGAALEAATAELEAAHQRWKTTHHGLASKILDEAPGSGHTTGAPYLRECLGNRLFTAATPDDGARLAS
ncbi:tryptophan 2,3-dioxygenase family protein [Pseudonocardia saturnea]